MSGRLLSKASDIVQFAQAAAGAAGRPPAIRFRNVIYTRVSLIRSDPNLNVFFEPTVDPAHANLVAYRIPSAPQLHQNAATKQSEQFYLKIARMFEVCEAADVSPLENLR